jgi:hypothetical protein
MPTLVSPPGRLRQWLLEFDRHQTPLKTPDCNCPWGRAAVCPSTMVLFNLALAADATLSARGIVLQRCAGGYQPHIRESRELHRAELRWERVKRHQRHCISPQNCRLVNAASLPTPAPPNQRSISMWRRYSAGTASQLLGTLESAVADAVLSARPTGCIREFHGIVPADAKAMAVPGVKIPRFPKMSWTLDKRHLRQFQSEQNGDFAVSLENRTYVGVFQRNRFKIPAIGFDIGEKGQGELASIRCLKKRYRESNLNGTSKF